MARTAQHVMDLIDAHLGTTRPEATVDEYLAGNPDREIHGVALTMMATLDVLRQAAARGLDLVISHEPLFFHHTEGWNSMLQAEADPVYAAKSALIARHGLVVRRLHDALHAAHPDRITVGTARSLGWLDFERSSEPGIFDVPTTTLASLAAHVSQALGAAALRYVGDPDLPVSATGVQPGFWGFDKNRETLARPDVDALVIGESHEWETVAYAADAVSAGLPKGLVIVGHVPSEQSGMAETAHRVADLLPDLPIAFIPAADPFRT